MTSNLTSNNRPVGVGLDSDGLAKGLVELSGISLSAVSATEGWFENIFVNGSSIYIRDGDTLMVHGNLSAVSYIGGGGGGGVTDHGALTGLADDDHPHYTLSATNANLSSLVGSVETSTIDLSAYIADNEAAWLLDSVITDHGAFTGLGDDDHPQYTLSSTNNNLSSLVGNIETSTIDLSAYIADNEGSWVNAPTLVYAPLDGPYITVSATGNLDNETVLTDSEDITWSYENAIISGAVEVSALTGS